MYDKIGCQLTNFFNRYDKAYNENEFKLLIYLVKR